MEVFITFRKGISGEDVIDSVFGSLESAQEHIIKTKFRGNDYYNNRSEKEFRKLANDYIEVHEVL